MTSAQRIEFPLWLRSFCATRIEPLLHTSAPRFVSLRRRGPQTVRSTGMALVRLAPLSRVLIGRYLTFCFAAAGRRCATRHARSDTKRGEHQCHRRHGLLPPAGGAGPQDDRRRSERRRQFPLGSNGRVT